MKILQRPAVAVATVVLGVVVFFAGVPLVILSDGGWPWETGISYAAGGPATVEIIDEDGTAYRFTGAPADAQHWLARKENDLKDAHGIPAKIAVGKVLIPVGLALALAGLAGLSWRLVTVRRARRTATG